MGIRITNNIDLSCKDCKKLEQQLEGKSHLLSMALDQIKAKDAEIENLRDNFIFQRDEYIKQAVELDKKDKAIAEAKEHIKTLLRHCESGFGSIGMMIEIEEWLESNE